MLKTSATLFLAALALAAQGPPPRHGGPGPQGHLDHMATALSLNETQKAKAATIFQTAHQSSTALRTSMRQAHEALTTAVKSNNTLAIDQAASQIGTLEAQRMSIESKAEAAFRQTLTADQLAKYDQMGHRGMGPGFGPPPPRR